jgi:hypothetical protein
MFSSATARQIVEFMAVSFFLLFLWAQDGRLTCHCEVPHMMASSHSVLEHICKRYGHYQTS